MKKRMGSFLFLLCSLFLVSRVLPVFTRSHSGDFLEQITEIMRIVVSDFLGNLGGTHLSGFQQFLRFSDPQRGQVLCESQAGLLGENRREMALGKMNFIRGILKHQIRIGKML